MDTPRVCVSFIFCCYNQYQYIDAAVKGVLSQDYPVAEFIFSDDCSIDGSYEELERAVAQYANGRPVVVNRNDRNLGLIAHVNLLVSLCRGELVVVASGDDISFPHRVSRLVESYLSNGKPMLLHSKAVDIDADGFVIGSESPHANFRRQLSLEEAAFSQSIYLGASGAWSRELIEKYGVIDYSCAFEDLVMGFRAVLENSILYIDECLLYYRTSVGMSQQVSIAQPNSLQRRKSQVCLMLDTLQQRRADLKVSDHLEGRLDRKLKKRISRLLVRKHFHFNPSALIGDLLLRPTAFFSAISSEFKFMRSLD
ncbi:glycosyltransferase [Zhongshania aquatica]|uniref:glycosyltransferase n=1 Tax=Zhongshania aquatica TaxID=2965069 RepID=UPI0022B46607|nr:glycosyltransferase [Marortus sp. BJYM1]